MPNLEEIDACWDEPSGTDVTFWELFGSNFLFNDTVDNRTNTKIYNQHDQYETRMACGSYGIQHCINICNYHTWGSIDDPQYLWEKFCKSHKTKEYDPYSQGSSLQDQQNYARRLWMIDAYYKIPKTDIEQACQKMCTSISQWELIYTGSKNINRKKTKESKDKVIVIGAWPAHIFMIDGYDYPNKFFRVRNSDWKHYKLKFDDIGSLFTIYGVIDKASTYWKDKIRAIVNQKKKNYVYEVRPLNGRQVLKWRPK